jgi:hypothetical protein
VRKFSFSGGTRPAWASRAKSILLISSVLIWLAAVSSWMMASDGVSSKNGYSREKAPELLELLTESPGQTDKILKDISVHQNLLATLQIEKNRLGADTKMIAQNEREQLMKKQFLEHFDRASRPGTASKVLLRFGRNHLHRGYDARGISTLGNFVAELALMRGKNAFNVGAFGARW